MVTTKDSAVVLINAVGMPVLLWAPLAERLAPHFRTVTWESRWALGAEGGFDPQKCDLDHQLIELTTLLETRGIDSTHIVCWCSGAHLALKFASLFPERTRSLVLLNGSLNLPETITRTDFEKNLRLLMPKIAANKTFAELYYKMFQRQSSDLMTPRNSALRDVTSAPFKTPELLYRYANVIARLFDEPELPMSLDLAMPVLVVSGTEDTISHPDTSREIARRINGASLVILEGADHHALYDDERVHNVTLDFLMKGERNVWRDVWIDRQDRDDSPATPA
jgi:pimeloyl-ACP methyl ester carboxylesterase